MHEKLPVGRKDKEDGDSFGFSELEKLNSEDQLDASVELEKQKTALIKEINEQIPFLAYGLSDKIRQNGLAGKVSVRGVLGDSWGVGVSKNNPRKDIPNIVTYPESILSDEKAVTNARLRHEIGNLNHSIDGELADLAKWCNQNHQDFRLIAPLVESVQEASVNYHEMRNSIADDPAAAFRPLYEKVIPVKDIASTIGDELEYKQAIDMTLLKSLGVAGLVDNQTMKNAEQNISESVKDSFSPKIDSIINQAVKTSSGKIRVQLVRDYLWPEFAKFIPEANGDKAEMSDNLINHSKAQEILELVEQAQAMPPEDLAVAQSFSDLVQDRIDEISQQLSEPNSSPSDVDNAEDASEMREQLSELQQLVDDLNNPEKASGEDLEELQFKINEVGINRNELDDEQLALLDGLCEFCQKTTTTYVRAMRFLMEEYQSRNPAFTDEMMEKMILHHHDTPSFTIYGKEAGEDFIRNTCPELDLSDFESRGMLLNFNLPDVLGRFWYRGGEGAKAQTVPEGAIEWGWLYRSGMPAIWRSVDSAPRQGLYLNRLNAFGQHDFRKYYYLYDAIDLGFALPDTEETPPESTAEPEDSDSSMQSQDNTNEDYGPEYNGGNDNDMQEQMSALEEGLESLNNTWEEDDSYALADALMDLAEDGPDVSDTGDSSGEPGMSDYAGLLEQLQDMQEQLESSFSDQALGQDGYEEFDIDDQDLDASTTESIANLEEIKEQQRRQLESVYAEESGLSGKVLEKYIEYREESDAFTEDLVDFFTEKFHLESDYDYARNQRRGNRLQHGWTSRILGRTALGAMSFEPEIFERKSIPKKPNFIWSAIIDNSGSCDGQIIEEEKKTAIGLVEVANRLNIPLEIVTFGEGNDYVFLKTFDQVLHGDQLAELVKLSADRGTPDKETLKGACQSVSEYAENFNRSYNFVYFMTDGKGSSGIRSVIKKYQQEMAITGIGLDEAADSIADNWGSNSVGVHDVGDLSNVLIAKIEDQIEEFFD